MKHIKYVCSEICVLCLVIAELLVAELLQNCSIGENFSIMIFPHSLFLFDVQCQIHT